MRIIVQPRGLQSPGNEVVMSGQGHSGIQLGEFLDGNDGFVEDVIAVKPAPLDEVDV